MNSAPISSRTLLAAALGVLALSLPARAGVLVVDAAGGGDFTLLSDAAAAANDGDTLLVRPGDYSGFFVLPVIVDRSLTIIADGTGPVLSSPIRVQPSAAGTRVLLRGLTVDSAGLNSGQEALVVQGGDVLAEDCSFKGQDGIAVNFGMPGFAGVHVTAGHLVLVRCTTQGGRGIHSVPIVSVLPKAGGPGLRALAAARVSVYGSTLTGGDGGDFFNNEPGHGAPGGGGLYSNGAKLFLAGSTMTGGQGGDGNLVEPSPAEAGGDAIILDFVAELQLLDVTLVPGAGGVIPGFGVGPQGDALDAISATVTQHPGAYRSYVLSSPTGDGEPVQLDFDGEPGDLVGIFWSVTTATLPMPGKQGVFHLGAPLFGPLVLGPVGGPDGQLSLSVPLPVLGLDPDGALTIYEQVFVKPSSGPLLLGSPTTHTIVDDSL